MTQVDSSLNCDAYLRSYGAMDWHLHDSHLLTAAMTRFLLWKTAEYYAKDINVNTNINIIIISNININMARAKMNYIWCVFALTDSCSRCIMCP